MQIDADQLLENALRDGIREGIKSLATRSYENPIEKLLKDALAKHAPAFLALLGGSIDACMGDPAFRASIEDAVRTQLAKTLVQRFGGELEKQVNQLKSDPATRARITLAIEGIVKDRSLATA